MIKLGLVLTDLYVYSQNILYHGIKKYCSDHNIQYFVFICQVPSDFDNIIKYSNTLDGVILFSSHISSLIQKEGLKKLNNRLTPIKIVSLGIELEGTTSIIVDNTDSVINVMDHLILEHGLEKIAFIKGPEDNMEANIRFDAYKTSLQKHGIKYDSKLVAPGNFNHGDGRKGLSLILDIRKEDIDAVLCCHDLSAFEVIKSLHERGINVPEKVAVVGFDNLDMCSSYTPSLTTIKQDFYNIGLLAGKYISDLIYNKIPAVKTKIKTSLIIRESCGCKNEFDFNNPNKKGKLSLIEFSDLLLNCEKQLYNKYKFDIDIDNFNSNLKNNIIKISNGIIYSLENNDLKELKNNINSILSVVDLNQYNISFWKLIIQDFFNVINSYDYSNDWLYKLSVLYSNSVLDMYEIERKILEFKRIDDRSLIQLTNYVGDKLMFSETNKELKDIIRRNLSTLKIKNLFIILFSELKSNNGELFFARNKENIFEKESTIFDINNLIPKSLGQASFESYIVSNLRIDKKQIGYVLINSLDAPNIIYNFLTEKITYGFINIRNVNKMNSYTHELESAVLERTKELKEANIKLQERTIRDQLTGLYNRRFLEDVVRREIDTKIKNKEGYNYAIILVDLDHFKQINDVYGHGSGDIVIKELGKTFTYVVRPVDYVVRLGGEEFLLILKDFNIDYLKKVVNKIRMTIKESCFVMENGDKIFKTCSLGAIFLGGHYPGLIDLKYGISIIDKALYISKNLGRDRGCIVNVDSSQFCGNPNPGQYIADNFDQCLAEEKINLIDCN